MNNDTEQKRFWYEENYTPSDKGKILIFDRKHFAFLFAYFALAFTAGIILSKLNYNAALLFIRIWVAFNQTVMIIRIINHIRIGDFTLKKELPIHLCNINVILLSVFAFTLSEKIFDFVFTYSILGALAAMLSPDSDSGRYPRINFRSLEFFFSHTTLTFMPIYIKLFLRIPYQMSNIPYTLFLFTVIAIADYIINKQLGSNYFFVTHAPANSPVESLEKKRGSVVYRVLYFICMTSICLIMHLIFSI